LSDRCRPWAGLGRSEGKSCCHDGAGQETDTICDGLGCGLDMPALTGSTSTAADYRHTEMHSLIVRKIQTLSPEPQQPAHRL